ncbi:Transferase [Macleaya cordata]|uniref:Transferase n=1 Tax=Macleaya cordata TaxID=56857 RepID=A0A200Q0P5_MACCD|nr:Transferase [Macleaya cordata]
MSSIHVENQVHENLVYDIKLSSVGPAKVTGTGLVYEPTNTDLIMKLHYLRGLYFFEHDAVEGLTVYDIKAPMFKLLNHFNINCGRFRRSESGRPYIKCNDCGVRIIEARCKNTIDEWLEMKNYSLHRLLVSNQVLGPELAFSPMILVQV